MKSYEKLEIIYFLNSVLLFTHEVDSAYWNEWKLFDLPGGIQIFLFMNIILMMIGLVGLKYVVLRRRSGLWFSLVQALCGLIAFFIHGTFIVQGHMEFTLPMSEILLVLIVVVSFAQGILSVRELMRPTNSAV